MPLRFRSLALVAVLATLGAACSGGSDTAKRVDAPGGQTALPVEPHSIVQLGDSIASGEGTLYGYTYDTDSDEWTGGNVDAPWPPPYPDCHVSPDAYGNKVATAYSATFAQFACTGASFATGVRAPEFDNGTQMRPAQFGNWSTQQDINGDYDAAKPDLVIVTLGADDVVFSTIVEDCIKNGYKHYWHIDDLNCIDGNPGPSVQQHFFDFLPTLKKNYATLVSWIEARAKANNVPVPKIVFTNYANPLPDQGTKCNDTSYLYPQQVDYLTTLLNQMNQIIGSTINGLGDKNVGVADISRAYQRAGVDHRWCTDDPWAYGLSIYHLYDPSSFDSQAPFHPTPDGQASIAEAVIVEVANIFKSDVPTDVTTTSVAPPTTQPASTSTSSVPTSTPDVTIEPTTRP
jgi:lysophospholipase L1-like esterase